MTDEVLVEVDAGVAVVTLNRPDRLNAWNLEMAAGYYAAMDSLGDDPVVRAIVVTGAGRGFCSGADMEILTAIFNGAVVPEDVMRSDDKIEPAVPKPVIAAVNGPAVGAGLARAMFCDVRFLSREAAMSAVFSRRGLIAENGLSWLLPRLVGQSRALDLLLSGRSVEATEALAIGLVDHVADDALAAAVDYAGEIAARCSPASLRDIKRQVWGDAIGTLPEALERSEALMRASFTRPDMVEGVSSYLEKRLPSFPPLT